MNLLENYRNVRFIAPFPAPDWSAYAIVTAWNPASQWISMRRNERRQRALLRRVDHSSHTGPVWGLSPDGDWQEASWLLQLPRTEAIGLAGRFGQHAIYWVEDGQLWLQPVLWTGDTTLLGTLASRWIVREITC